MSESLARSVKAVVFGQYEILDTKYYGADQASVNTYAGKPFTSSTLLIEGVKYNFWTGMTDGGSLRCHLQSWMGYKDINIMKYTKDRGELLMAVIDRFLSLNSVKKELI